MDNMVIERTCGVDVEVGGLVGYIAQRLQSRPFSDDLCGVSLGLVHLHLKWALCYLLAGKEHSHLQGP